MIKTKNKSARKSNDKKTISINHNNNKNIILISHSKNKSVDLKHKKNNLLLSSNNLLKNAKNKSNIIKNSPNNIDIKKCRLKKFGSFPNFIEDKNKKKFFFEDNFFYKNWKNFKNFQKANNNIFFKNNSSSKNQDNLKINKYTKRIIKKKNIIIPNNIDVNKIQAKNKNKYEKIKYKTDENKNIENQFNDNSLYNKDTDKKHALIKTNLIYIKNKINKNDYAERKCSSSRFILNKKQNIINNNKINNIKNESITADKKYILNDSLESHNTVYDEDLKVDYNLALLVNSQAHYDMNDIKNRDNKNKSKRNSNDKLYKKIITRKRNIKSASLNNSDSQKKLSRSFSQKNYTINSIPYRSEKNFSGVGYNLKSQIIYRTINSKKMALFNTGNGNGLNYCSLSSLLTTQNQTNKCKDNNTNIIYNKDVAEFLYSDDLIEGNSKNKDINIKKWLNDINLSIYFQNFYDNNIYNINELIIKMKNIRNKNKLYENIENTFNIHVPGHIYRILCKLEIDSGLLDSKISNFFVPKNDEYINKINNMKPSLLLKQNNSCENFFNCHKDKSNLKNFLKKYHLITFYYNFCQNGFDLINFVILQMFSNYYSIDDYILENNFHIYNKKDRILVLDSLLKEKKNIELFINSDKFQQTINYFNINYYNNMSNYDNYFISKESEDNNCNMCFIF
jgi:hypothetical protein